MPTAITSHSEGVLLSVKLQPRSSRNEIGECLGDEIKIRVTAPPVDSAANLALVELLAEVLDCPKSAIHLVRGQTSRHKTLLVKGITSEQARTKLKVNV